MWNSRENTVIPCHSPLWRFVDIKTANNVAILLSGVNFTNILRAALSYWSVVHSFWQLILCVCIYLRKKTGKKLLIKFSLEGLKFWLSMFETKKRQNEFIYCNKAVSWKQFYAHPPSPSLHLLKLLSTQYCLILFNLFNFLENSSQFPMLTICF